MTTPNGTSKRLNDVMKLCVQPHKDIQILEAKRTGRNQTVQELTKRVHKLETDKAESDKDLYKQVKHLEDKLTTQNHTIQELAS
mmetsp:Transcript_16678/g.20584  ORF Transcript_16678/g.20584 Transcript_16678/m.20584 type:complete len:84 (-) Transcript_16678:111-362(-)